MSFALLAPLALAALAALALPLLLHLYRRRQPPRLVDFAALRWLAGPQRPRRRVELRDRRLLATRLLLVALGALLLATPVLRDGRAGKPWVVVAPGVDVGALTVDENAEWRWLAPGFPPLDASVDRAQPLASLIRELDARLPPATALALVVSEHVDGLDGGALQLSRAVDWRIAPALVTPASASEEHAPIGVAIAVDAGHPGQRYVDAAAAAWRTDPTRTRVDVVALGDSATPPADLDALVWLREAPPPPAVLDWARAGGVLLRFATADAIDPAAAVLWRSARGSASLRARGGERILDCAPTPACLPELHDADFPALLRGWLVDAPPPPARARALDVQPRRADLAWPLPSQALDGWLALLIALLFVFERWLASGRRP